MGICPILHVHSIMWVKYWNGSHVLRSTRAQIEAHVSLLYQYFTHVIECNAQMSIRTRNGETTVYVTGNINFHLSLVIWLIQEDKIYIVITRCVFCDIWCLHVSTFTLCTKLCSHHMKPSGSMYFYIATCMPYYRAILMWGAFYEIYMHSMRFVCLKATFRSN